MGTRRTVRHFYFYTTNDISRCSHYYKFETSVNANGELEFLFNSKKIAYYALAQFINQEYKMLVTKEINIEK